MQSRILFEDRDIIVAHKPAGLAVQTARLGQRDMVSELKNHLCGESGKNGMAAGRREPYLGIVHRLDQPVEGILVFGKTAAATASLTGQLRMQGDEGSFSKRYYAVLCGIPTDMEGRLTDYLYKQAVRNGGHTDYKAIVTRSDSPSRDCTEGEESGECRACPGSGGRRQPLETGPEGEKVRRAVLEYRILQAREEQGLALADIHIHTGRFHQIRAQMAHAGMPLLGDSKYGNERTQAQARALGIRNVALCAYLLTFAHPVSKERMDFRAEPENPAFSSFSQL